MSERKDSGTSGFVACPACSSYHLPTKKTLQDGVYSANCVNCEQFFKFKATALSDASNSINFTVNGKKCTVSNEYAASLTLVHYLRQTRMSVGTKAMCYEGGCGVCLVAIKLYNPQLKKKVEMPVNSCLVPLYSCDGHDITTIEGLGSVREGLHAIQDRLANKDGAQCGYCSSAQVMNMFGILKENPKPTMEQVENGFDATICRCTGYRPILDAMKSFAVDAPRSLGGGVIDIEELDAKLCHKNNKPCTCRCSSNGNSPCHDSVSDHPTRPVHIVGAQAQWFKPTTLADMAKLLKQYKTQNYRLTFGNTGSGVFKDLAMHHYDIIINTRGIQELYGIQTTPNITLGSSLTINNVINIFDQARDNPSYPYAGHVADHWRYVAMNGIRNLGCWAGNIMMKHIHNEFPSDVFTCFETIGVQLQIMDENGNKMTKTLLDFLKLDMKGKMIIGMIAPAYTGSTVQFRTYRTSLRLQACHTYSVTGFKLDVDESQNYLVKSKPSVIVLGINAGFIHATLTENYLVNKKLGDPSVLKQAFQVLASELKPSFKEGQSSAAYRKSLVLAMFYKCCLDICKKIVDPRYMSGGPKIVRPLMKGTQDYGTNKEEWPVSKPMPKTIAGYLTSGEPAYVDDIAPAQGQLHAAPVLTIYGNAKISSIDASAALAYPGVIHFIQAKDIPKGGVNNWRPILLDPPGAEGQEMLCSGEVGYAGQPLGIIVADLELTARHAATLVKVTYTDIKPPLIDTKEAITKKSFFPKQGKPTVVGDPEGAIKNAPNKISGSMYMGEQYHFHMETQTSVCTPTETGGMHVNTTTQWVAGALETVSQVLGLKESEVTVEVERLGGAFGGKISQNFWVAGMCALAAWVSKSPVKMHLDIHDNMKMVGKRPPFYAEYEAGVGDAGQLSGIKVTLYEDLGISNSESVLGWANHHLDGAYYCPNWLYKPVTVKSNKPSSTYCRTPVAMPSIFVMETIMDHIAKQMKMDHMIIRKANLYVKNQMTPWGEKLSYCNIRPVVAELETSIKMEERIKEVQAFNKANRWRKRGLSMMPSRYGLTWLPGNYNTMVTIFSGDGSVAISHGGIDVGQGINTKAIQTCAYELGIPMDMIRVKKASSIINANSFTTGGAMTSELVCKGVIECCKTLKARMAPVKAKMVDPTWKQLTAKCLAERLLLNASYMTNAVQPAVSQYSIYSCAVSEVEIDVLTGQFQIRQSDILYETGDSLNPRLDIGQAEGAFVMGVGFLMQEGLEYDSKTGELLNSGTWEYKPPMSKDIPVKYNVKFVKNNPNPVGVLRSKTAGEPPLILSITVFLATKHAIEEARAEVGRDEYFTLESPCTVEKIQTLCMNDAKDFVLKPASSFWK